MKNPQQIKSDAGYNVFYFFRLKDCLHYFPHIIGNSVSVHV